MPKIQTTSLGPVFLQAPTTSGANADAPVPIQGELPLGHASPMAQASGFEQAGSKPGHLTTDTQRQIDALWQQGKFPELVTALDQHVRTFEAQSPQSLGAEATGERIGALYVLQHRIIGLLNHLSNLQSPAATRQCLQLAQRLANLQTDLFERAVVLADQGSKNAVGPWQLFRNTQKEPGFHSPTAQQEYFIQKLQEFIARGGRINDIKSVTAEALAEYENGALCEWAVDAYDTARMARGDTKANAGHTLLAWGQDVLAAGSMRLFKDPEGNIQNVVLGTFSGHFRSGAQYLVHMARHLAAAGVAPERITMHAGEAATPRGLELVHRALGLEGAQSQRAIAELEAKAARYNPFAPLRQDTRADSANRAGFQGDTVEATLQLADALFAMNQISGQVLVNGMVLETLGEASMLAGVIDNVLNLSQRAGSPAAYHRALAKVAHLESLRTPHADAEAQKIFQALSAKWKNHEFGANTADPAALLGPKPVGNSRVRIVATLAPNVPLSRVQNMIMAGMTTARLNTAHGTADELRACIDRVRQAAADVGRDVAVQIDLAGPKIRLGKFKNPSNLQFNDIWLKTGDKVTLTTADVLGDHSLLPVNYPALAEDVTVGQRILMNDGLVVLTALSVDKDATTGVAKVEAEVLQGDKVWDNKGINLPDSKLSIETITPQDFAMVDALLPHVDMMALSFVRNGRDVLDLQQYMASKGRVVPIIAKIERAEAVDNLEEIALVSDAMMVARGDLGVEIGYEKVPGLERRINQLGNRLGKPTMVATEVLISMVKDATRPSRGDVQALHSAIVDQGADAIMLGKETSFPEHADAVVRAAARIIEQAEKDKRQDLYRRAAKTPPEELNSVTARIWQRASASSNS